MAAKAEHGGICRSPEDYKHKAAIAAMLRSGQS